MRSNEQRAMNSEVSTDVRRAAVEWAEENTDDHYAYIAAVAAFIAGATFVKPIEQTKEKDNGRDTDITSSNNA